MAGKPKSKKSRRAHCAAGREVKRKGAAHARVVDRRGSESESHPSEKYRHHVHHSTEGHVCAVKDERIAHAIVAALNKDFAGTFRYEHR